MAEKFEMLGYDLVCADGIPGFYTVLDTGRPGPEIMILAELDSVICPEHKDAEPVTEEFVARMDYRVSEFIRINNLILETDYYKH